MTYSSDEDDIVITNTEEIKDKKKIEAIVAKDLPMEAYKNSSIYENFGDPSQTTQKIVFYISP